MNLHHFYHTWISPQRWFERAGVRAPMQIVTGLVLLTSCVLMFAKTFQLMPNEDVGTLRVRMVISQMTSSRVAAAIAAGDFAGAEESLKELLNQRDDVLSAGVRQLDGKLAIATANHAADWIGADPNGNTLTHIQIPLYDDHHPWGEFEIVFKPELAPAGWAEWWARREVRFEIFVVGGCFVLYWFFLSRMLRMLDPSAAVPERLQLIMDTLVEGIAILDNNDQIVMVNHSFAQTAFLHMDRLIGRSVSTLPWQAHDGPHVPEVYPWQAVRHSDLPQRGVPMRLQVGARHTRHLNVNASPILDPGGVRRGVMVTFDDQTAVESENLKLAKFVASFSEAASDIHQFHLQAKDHAESDPLAKLEELAVIAREIAGGTNPVVDKIPEPQEKPI